MAKVSKMEVSNSHIREYLVFYLSLPYSPRYAVLIDGPWGIGKTHLVREILATRFPEETQKSKYLYVSLYGVASVNDIDAAVFQAMYPLLTNKSVKLFGKAAKAAMNFFGADPEINVGDVVNKFTASVYVFDDLERCDMPVNQVLGYINEFVEQDGCKVVLIANQDEVKKGKSYRKKREKVVGKILQIQSPLREALSVFIAKIEDEETRKALNARVSEISDLFNQSELNNLRILQQTLWDFERVHKNLKSRHKRKFQAVTSLLLLFFALSFEVKSGRLGLEDLHNRVDSIVAGMIARNKKDGKTTPLADASNRYPQVRLDDTLLSDEVLIDVLIKGVVDAGSIAASLDLSQQFIAKEKEPAWRTVWHGLERTEQQFERALNTTERQFEERKFTAIGEILHVFGLRLWLAKSGILEKSTTEVVRECCEYIDDLFSAGRLEPSPIHSFDENLGIGGYGSYGGLGVYERETEELKEIFEYLQTVRSRAREESYPAKAAELLVCMKSDPNLFFRRLNLTNSEDNIYWRVPILAFIDPEDFVDELLGLSPSLQRSALMAVKARYEHASLDGELKKEKPWLETVAVKLEDKASRMLPITELRLNKFVQWYIRGALEPSEN